MTKKIIFLVSLVFVMCGGAFATILNVGSGQTYSDIPTAYAAAVSGDTINIHAGTYNDVPAMSGDDGKNNVTFRAAVNTRNAQGFYEDVRIKTEGLYMRYNDGITFEGLIFEGTTYTDSADPTNLQYTLYLRNVSGSASSNVNNLTVKNCIFTDSGRTPIYSYSYTGTGNEMKDWVIENNTFYNNAEVANIRMYRAVTNMTMKDNLFLYATGAYKTDPVVSGDGKGWGVAGQDASSAYTVTYSAFYGNEEGPNNPNATLGTGTLTAVDPTFETTTRASQYVFYLDETVQNSILTGASDGGYMGARPMIPEPATIALLGLGGSFLVRRRRRH